MLHREAVSKAILRWRLPRLQWGFDSFARSVAAQREDAEKQVKEQGWRLAHEAVKRELDMSIESSRSVLHHELQHNQDRLDRIRVRQLGVSRACIRRMLRANLAKGFELFTTSVLKGRRLRRTCAWVIAHMKRRVLVRAFDTFLCFVEREQTVRKGEEKHDRQNTLLKDVLAGTAIGQVLREKTLQDFALSDLLQEKKVRACM